MKIRCPNKDCNIKFEPKSGQQFCHHCGAKLYPKEDSVLCPSCERRIPVKSRFCWYCGVKIERIKDEKSASKKAGGNKPDFKTAQKEKGISENPFLRKKIREKSTRRLILGLVVSLVFLFLTLGASSEDYWFWGIALLVSLFFTIRRLLDLDDKKHYCYQLVECLENINSIDGLSILLAESQKKESIEVGSFTAYDRLFLVKDSVFKFETYPLLCCSWIYKQITSHKLYGLVTTSKSHALILHFPKEKVLSIPGSEEQVDEYLYRLVPICQFAKMGYE